jgi:hypothetical protein
MLQAHYVVDITWTGPDDQPVTKEGLYFKDEALANAAVTTINGVGFASAAVRPIAVFV